MTWSYAPGVSQPRHQVRLLIGDVIAIDPQMQDEEIDWLVSQEQNVYAAAAACADSLAARYARQVDKAVGDLRISFSQKQAAYEAMALQLRSRRGNLYQVPTAAGIDVSERKGLEQDESVQQPYFYVGMMEHPSARDLASSPDAKSDVEQP